GHALISETERPNSVAHLTVTPLGKALGFMRPSGRQERYLYTKEYLEDQIAVFLGGALAEEAIYGARSTGATNDFEQAARLSREIIRSGLSPLGIIDEEYTPKDKINEVFTQILKQQEERARGILTAKLDSLKQAAELLFTKEKISGEEFRTILQKTA
ncbi:MAG: ATPase, partial [Firmicutes bacterium]|nr:ATPase [Bacillota bacterium]